MSEHTYYKCSFLDEIEKDINSYLNTKPTIKEILQKKELTAQDVIDFITLVTLERTEVKPCSSYKEKI
tara:strand:+ start:427 stop:630 length:204 start_codon:yes stop_codon:yes gene_type:complete